MEYISSKNIFMLTRDMLKLVNRKVMDHGSRVAYILMMMLHETGRYEEYEIAEFCYLASLHDIGAYNTEDLSKPLQFESRDSAPHSIYGHLFFKYLSAFGDRSKILLYHHTSYMTLQNMEFEYKDIANYLNLADAVDVYMTALREKFNIGIFRKWIGKRFSPESLALLLRAEEKHHLIDKIRSKEFKKDLDAQMDYFILTNEEKKKSLEFLMYCGGFKNVEYVVSTTTCLCICEEIAKHMKLGEADREILYYAALLHDIGMLGLHKEFLDPTYNPSASEKELIKRHIAIEERIFKMRDLNEDVLRVAIAHRERKDGSGYPNGTKGKEHNKLQKILQVASGMTAKSPLPKEKVISELEQESASGKLDREIVDIVLADYDGIVSKVAEESEAILSMYTKLNTKYKKISEQFAQ